MRKETTHSTRTFMTASTANAEATPPRPRRKLLTKKTAPWLIVVVLVAVSVFLLIEFKTAQNKLQAGSQAYYASQTKRLAKLIVLPVHEKPTIITVKDPEKLKSQQFYANTEAGDITFVYTTARKAILYRPSRNIIINVAPVSSASTSNPAAN